MNDMLIEALDELKRDIFANVERACKDFYKRTGVTPSDIHIRTVDVTGYSDKVRRYAVGGVSIELGEY